MGARSTEAQSCPRRSYEARRISYAMMSRGSEPGKGMASDEARPVVLRRWNATTSRSLGQYMRSRFAMLALVAPLSLGAQARGRPTFTTQVRQFIQIDTPTVALTHVR